MTLTVFVLNFFAQKTCGVSVETRNILHQGNEVIQCKQEDNFQSMTPKEEQIKKRREQNRFRMRALRASDSEVALRLRERNKFRMRTLRASDSQVAQSLRERNKYRMRELRSSESHLTHRLVGGSTIHVDSSLDGECLPNNKTKIEPSIEHCQDMHMAGTVDDSWKADLRADIINICAEGNKFPWIHVEKGPVHNISYDVLGSQENEKQVAYEGFLKREQSVNGVVHKVKSLCYDIQCIPLNRNICKHNIYNKNELHALESEGKGNEKSEMEYMVDAVNCMQCDGFVVGSHEVGTCAVNNSRQQHKNLGPVAKNETVVSFDGQSSVRMGVGVHDLSQCEKRCNSHFLTFQGGVTEQTKLLIKDVPSEIREIPVSEILDQAERRREKGKLRMRLKRHTETEEEAERRRERGRLRMRVLRASETEEQAARRRELNRLRMRMKRNSARH